MHDSVCARAQHGCVLYRLGEIWPLRPDRLRLMPTRLRPASHNTYSKCACTCAGVGEARARAYVNACVCACMRACVRACVLGLPLDAAPTHTCPHTMHAHNTHHTVLVHTHGKAGHGTARHAVLLHTHSLARSLAVLLHTHARTHAVLLRTQHDISTTGHKCYGA